MSQVSLGGGTAIGTDAIAIGNGSVAADNYSIAIGNCCVSSNAGAISMGNACVAHGARSFAIGSASVASGYQADAIGTQCEARGGYSVACCIATITTEQAASSFACGEDTICYSYRCFSANEYCEAGTPGGGPYGVGAAAMGSTTRAIGVGAQSGGISSYAKRDGQRALAGGNILTEQLGYFACDAQTSEIVLRGTTQGLSVGETVELKGGVGKNIGFGPDDNRAYTVKITVNLSGRIRPSGAKYVRTLVQTATIRKNAGTTTIVSTDTLVSQGDSAVSSWTMTLGTDLSIVISTGTTRAQIIAAARVEFTETVFPMDAPTELSGCALWLESNRGITLNGDTWQVSQWNDQSGNNNHFSQDISDYQPLLVAHKSGITNGDGGNFSIKFNGINDFLNKSSGSLADLVDANGKHTTFLVFRTSATSNTNSDPKENESIIADFNGKYGFSLYGPPTIGYAFQDNGSVVKASAKVESSDINILATCCDSYFLRTLYYRRSPPFTITGINSRAGSVFIGKNYNGSKFTNMDLYEVIVYNRALSEDEQTQVYNYLSLKYRPSYANEVYEDAAAIDSSNLKVWIRPDLGLSRTSSSINSLADQGALAKDISATGSTRPTWALEDNSYNHRPVLCFNGNQELESNNYDVELSQPNTVYIVGEQPNGGGIMFGGSIGTRHQILQNTGNVWSIYAGSNFVNATTTQASPHICCSVFNGDLSAIYIDDHNTPQGIGNPGFNSLNKTTIGGLTGGVGGKAINGTKIAEVIIYSGAHDLNTRKRVMNYLKRRYNI